MTDRERMLSAIRGEKPDRVPFVPRLEFWHRARLRNGTLPPELRGLNRMEIADALGVGYYSVIPDFTACADHLDMIDRALGLYRLPVLLYEYTLEGVDRIVTRRGRETLVEYRTPLGSVRTGTIFTDEMLEAGASVPWTTEHAIREPKDFATVGYIFSHLKAEPKLERYAAQLEEVGERGIVAGYVSGSLCPLHQIMREFMTTEQFFYALHDYPALIEGLVEQMTPYCRRIQEIVAESDAEVVLLGGNYDDSITYPRFFRKYLLDPLRDYAGLLHSKGKFLMTHTDGENRRLMPLYLESGFDVADSVCPKPMTSMPVDETLEAFRGRVTVMGGIPSVLLCKDSAGEADFRAFVDGLFGRWGRETRFIAGVSDMVTADCEWDRLRYIAARAASLA